MNGDENGIRLLGRLTRYIEVRERLASCRIGLVGPPSDWLVASRPEPAVVREVWGPEVVDIPTARLMAAFGEVRQEDAEMLGEEFSGSAREISRLRRMWKSPRALRLRCTVL